jgi:hypothetical protein
MRPPSRRRAPKERAYAVTTHWRSRSERPIDCWAAGRAMLTIVPSRTTTSWVSATTTRIHQRFLVVGSSWACGGCWESVAVTEDPYPGKQVFALKTVP